MWIVRLLYANVRIVLPVKHVKWKLVVVQMIIAVIMGHVLKQIESRCVNVHPVMRVNFVKFDKISAQIIRVKVVNVKIQLMVLNVNVRQELLADDVIYVHVIIYHAMKMHNVLIYRYWAQHDAVIVVYAQRV